MISCIFTTVFHAIFISVDAITNITTIISNPQTNFCIMPRALYRVFQIVIRGGVNPPPVAGGIGNFAGGRGDGSWGFFYRVVRTKGGVILTIQDFFKVKKAFCEY